MKLLTILSTSVMAAGLAACAVTQATIDPNSERNVQRSFRDLTAARAIKARMLRVEGFDLNDVSVDVEGGIVVLAGAAPRDEDKVEAERIAWSAPGIRQVGNEIYVGRSNGLLSKTKDDLISTSVRTKLAGSNSVRNLNYKIETRDSVVYLMGVARTQDELAEAARLASITRGVKEVVSYATIKGEMPNSYHGAAGTAHVAQAPAISSTPYNGAGNIGADDADFWGTPVDASPIDPTAPLPYRPGHTELDADALESGEPILRDPYTGEIIELPPGVKPIPYTPPGPGSLGAGGKPLPPGAVPSQVLGSAQAGLADAGNSVKELGVESVEDFMGGTSVTVSKPYTMDGSGNQIPVRWDGNSWVAVIK